MTNDHARGLLLILAVLCAIVADVRALRRRWYSFGMSRQTTRGLIIESRPWWVTPLLWGIDTGLMATTFRVSSVSWVVLVASVLGFTPGWIGFVFGAAFGIPFLMSFSLAPFSAERRGRLDMLRISQGVCLVVMSGLGVAVALGPVVAGSSA